MRHTKLLTVMFCLVFCLGLVAGCGKSAQTEKELEPTNEVPDVVENPQTAPETYPVDSETSEEINAATEAEVIYPVEVEAAEQIIVGDALGRQVVLEGLPQRVVVIGKATSLLNNSLFMFPEAQERIVAYEERLQLDRNFVSMMFASASQITLLDRDAGAEQIAPFNPDLVIMKTYMRDSIGLPIEAIGIPTLYLDLETPEQFFADLRSIGAIFGNPQRAEELIAFYQANEARIEGVLSNLTNDEKPSVVMLQHSDKGGEVAFKVPSADFLQSTMVQKAGGEVAWGETQESGWNVVTLESIAAWNPEVIILVNYQAQGLEVIDSLKQDPTWQSLQAVQNGNLYAFPVDFLSWDQPDPRWAIGELWLAKTLHPERFAELDFTQELINFYNYLYGFEEAEVREKVLPLLTGSFQ